MRIDAPEELKYFLERNFDKFDYDKIPAAEFLSDLAKAINNASLKSTSNPYSIKSKSLELGQYDIQSLLGSVSADVELNYVSLRVTYTYKDGATLGIEHTGASIFYHYTDKEMSRLFADIINALHSSRT